MTAENSNRIPKYRRQRSEAHDRAFVVLNGQRLYLGPYDSAESRQLYEKIIAEWLANGRQLPVDPKHLTLVELCDQFWTHAETYYRRPDGTPTSSHSNYKRLLQRLIRLYGDTPVVDFGPGALRTIRQTLIDDGWCRGTVNQAVRMIRHVFKWGVSEEMVPAEVHTRLSCLIPLRKGRGQARETPKVRPVPEDMIEDVRPHLNQQVDSMVQLQLLCGCRPNEIVRLRPVDIDMSGDIWITTYAEHKTSYLGIERSILFGPRAQELIRPFLGVRRVDAFLFSPREAEAERRLEMHAGRRTPLNYGNRPGKNRKSNPQKDLGERYTVSSYRRAIHYACDRASPPPEDLARRRVKGARGARWETPAEHRRRLGAEGWRRLQQWRRDHRWSPNQLRHNAATRLREQFGIDVAQTVAGHAMGSEITAAVYAEASLKKAMEAMRQVG